ncbi:S1C family serine protease [Micromonospora sp. NPDC003241]
MAVQTGLGEPRGPWFVSPDLGPDGRGGPDGTSGDRAAWSWRRRLLAGLAVVTLSTGSGALAGGWVAGRDGVPGPAAASAAPVPAELVTAAEKTVPGVVSVLVGDGGGASATGSGFAVDTEQHIITNDHILAKGRGAVTVELPDGRRLAAEVVGREPGSDLAVLRVPPSAGLTALPLAKPGSTRVGEPVLAVGSPLGLPGTVTAGIVSALDRQVRLGDNRHRAVQTDASINPGNSGGPLVNARGEVVGVNTAIATIDGNGSIGIGFAIPIEQVQQTADTIIGKGG